MTSNSSSALTPDEINFYKSEGFLLGSTDMFSESSFAELLHTCDELRVSILGENKSGSISKVHLKAPLLLRWILSSSVLDKVEQLIGPNIGMWSSSLFYKTPHSQEVAYWHQDIWGIYRFNFFESKEIINFTISLTESNKKNGGLRFLPKTHREVLPHTFVSDNTGLITLPDMIDPKLLTNTSDAVDSNLLPNQFSVHNVNLVHGSEANTSDLPRHTLSARFFSTEHKCNIENFKNVGFRPIPVLVRGKDVAGSGLNSLFLPDKKFEG